MTKRVIAYARAHGKNAKTEIETQSKLMTAHCIEHMLPKPDIFSDECSEEILSRDGLRAALTQLKEGDILLIPEFDILTIDHKVLTVIKSTISSKKADLQSINPDLANSKAGKALQTFMDSFNESSQSDSN